MSVNSLRVRRSSLGSIPVALYAFSNSVACSNGTLN